MSNDQSSPGDLEEVLRTWGPKIYALALRLSCRTDEAEDIAQETFVKACEHWQDFRKEASAGTWLYRICVNIWKNRLRAERRRAFWHRLAALGRNIRAVRIDETEEDVAGPEPALDANLESAERLAGLSRALERLVPEDRAILVMREIEGRTYEEIAQWLDVPLGTVKSRLGRTRDKLRALYPHPKTEPRPGEKS